MGQWAGTSQREELSLRFAGMNTILISAGHVEALMQTQIKCAACNGIGASWNNSAAPPCTRCKGLGYFKVSEPHADGDYPNAASAEYKANFVLGAYAGGLRDIPATMLSWAIDRAIENGIASQRAGAVFADVYYKVQAKPDYQDAQRRNGILKREAFLLSEYEKELRK